VFQICPNGVVCFGRRFEGYTIPATNRAVDAELAKKYCLAPYFTDLQPTTASTSSIFYQVYDFSAVTSSNDAVLDVVSGLVDETYQRGDFSPALVIKSTWSDLQRYDGNAAQVSRSWFCRVGILDIYSESSINVTQHRSPVCTQYILSSIQ